MKILVTGGSGFLGSHVAEALSAAGHAVTIFDAAPSPWLLDGQTMVVGDILDADALAAAVSGVEVVFHFAALADIGHTQRDPLNTARINILGTLGLLEAARQAGVRRFVFASSVYVFSKTGSFYGVSKQSCERFIEMYRSEFGLDYTILRYGSLYGRRAGSTNVIHQMVYDALNRQEISYPGTGEEIREYIHVRDAAALSVEILEEAYANRHLVLTGTERFRVREIMQMIAEIAPGDVALGFAEEQRDSHYTLTPYAFQPQLADKLVRRAFVDLGQGLLDVFHEAAGVPGDR